MDDLVEHLPPPDAEKTPKPECTISPKRRSRESPIGIQSPSRIRKTWNDSRDSSQARKKYDRRLENFVMMRVLAEQMAAAEYTEEKMMEELHKFMSGRKKELHQ